MQHYLAASGLGRQRVQGRCDIPENFRQAARLLATKPDGPTVVEWVLKNKGQKNIPYYVSLIDLSSKERELLEAVVTSMGEDCAFISSKDDTLELTVDDDMYTFWWGRRWLEWYVFDVLAELSHLQDIGLHYNMPRSDVRFVWDTDDVRRLMHHLLVIEDEEDEKGKRKISLPLNELDVAAVRGGRLLVCECKTGGRALRSEHFYEFNVIGRRLGTFADMVYVTDVPNLANPFCDDASVRRQAVRALTQDIAVVGREQLPDLAEFLAEPDKSLRRQKNEFGLR